MARTEPLNIDDNECAHSNQGRDRRDGAQEHVAILPPVRPDRAEGMTEPRQPGGFAIDTIAPGLVIMSITNPSDGLA